MKSETKLNKLAIAYYNAKMHVVSSGYGHEVDWQEDLNFEHITEKLFLQEAAWVVLASGMGDHVIRIVFPKISKAFCHWKSSKTIEQNKGEVREAALKIFSYEKKIDSILEICHIVFKDGFKNVIKEIREKEIDYIISLPFMGPATSYHLAKNIGLQVAKPDRHLVRIANINGYRSPNEMCSDLSILTHDKISVIDIVLWRYAAINKNYLHMFQA